VLAAAFNLAGDGGTPVAEDAAGGGDVNPSDMVVMTMVICASGVFNQYKGVPKRLVLQPSQA
jgi:hypothetical protein